MRQEIELSKKTKIFLLVLYFLASLSMFYLTYKSIALQKERDKDCLYDINEVNTGLLISMALRFLLDSLKIDLWPESVTRSATNLQFVNSIFYLINFMKGIYIYPAQIIKKGACGDKQIFWVVASLFLAFYFILAVLLIFTCFTLGMLCYISRKNKIKKKVAEKKMNKILNNLGNRDFDFEKTLKELEEYLKEIKLDDNDINILNNWFTTDFNKDCKYDSCIICLDDFKSEDKILSHPGCTHVFHPICLIEWLKTKPQCPTCKTYTKINILKKRREKALRNEDINRGKHFIDLIESFNSSETAMSIDESTHREDDDNSNLLLM